MLTITDEILVKQLQAIAERQHMAVEDVLRAWAAPYDAPQPTAEERDEPDADMQARIQALEQEGYARAMAYWQSNGNSDRLSLSFEDFSAQFWGFDTDDVPYLVADIDPQNLPDNPLLVLALSANYEDFVPAPRLTPTELQNLLRENLADDLLQRMRVDSHED